MRPLETIEALSAFERRGPGTDAERRAARWLAGELIAGRHRVRIETFWCRPNWALAHAWHVALALAGSLVTPSQPIVGAILLAIALASIVSDEVTGISPGRRLTPERASQNVVARAADANAHETRSTLIVTANYDAGRTALVYRDAPRRLAAYLGRVLGPLEIGWLAWLSIAIVWLLAIAIVRATVNHPSSVLGAIQLPPTVALVIALALLLEAAAAPYGPAANDNASGSAVAIALTRALAAEPPEDVAIELVLAGAGQGGSAGIRQYLRSRKQAVKQGDTVVLGLAPCGSGTLHYWRSDGRLIPVRYARSLRARAAATEPARPHRGRGATPALEARARGLPAIAIGSLDEHGLPPHSHQPADVPTALDEAELDRALEFALLLTNAVSAATRA